MRERKRKRGYVPTVFKLEALGNREAFKGEREAIISMHVKGDKLGSYLARLTATEPTLQLSLFTT